MTKSVFRTAANAKNAPLTGSARRKDRRIAVIPPARCRRASGERRSGEPAAARTSRGARRGRPGRRSRSDGRPSRASRRPPRTGARRPSREPHLGAEPQKRSGSYASTRQKSSVEPTAGVSGSRRPRRRPTPPTSRSRKPAQLPKSDRRSTSRLSPPIRRIGANARAGGAGTLRTRESTKRPCVWIRRRPRSALADTQRVRPAGRREVLVLVDERPCDRRR